MRIIHGSAILLAFASSLPATSFSQSLVSQCKVFLEKPIFTTTTVNMSKETSDNFRLLQCSATWKNASEAQSAGIDVTIPIYDLPVPFNLSWDNTKVEQWKSTNCSEKERDFKNEISYYQAVLSVDPISAKTAYQCFHDALIAEVDKDSTSAIRCSLTETSAAYVFEARWRRTDGETGPNPNILDFTVVNTSCQNGHVLAKGLPISEGGIPVLCLINEKPAAFSLTTDRGGCALSGTVRPPKLILPEAITLTQPMFISGQDVELQSNTRIITNGYPLTINARKIILKGSVRIQSFETSSAGPMKPGNSAGIISISADEVEGQGGVSILNAGQLGGQGSVGPKGSFGNPGRPGVARNHQWKKNCPVPYVCDTIFTGCEGGEDGRPGENGSPGYAGMPGMPGGSAGEVRLDVPLTARSLFSVLTNTDLNGQPASCNGLICGGAGGKGGPGGEGGDGGLGGPGAPKTTYCGGTNPGPNGNKGPKGPQGPDGFKGANAIFR